MSSLAETSKWRRRLREQSPEYYCASCTSIVYADEDSCGTCGNGRPERGWSALTSSTQQWLGRVIDGRYMVAQLLGQGASAEVYRVESLSIPRPFAIKIVHSQYMEDSDDGDQIRARLRREIEALSALRNPHIVPLYEVVPLSKGNIAIVMEYVEGTTLEYLVERDGPLQVRRACDIVRQIADGLCEVHEHGMIHRDLKPENVMVFELPSGTEFVRILDFGAVWLESGVKLTQGFLGTPMYTSPEQVVDEGVDHRSDIYSLGAIFFFLLTGKPPFDGDNIYEVLRRHIDDEAPRLSTMMPQSHFPAPLEALVARMLEKDPDDRPQHFLEVIGTIDDLYRDGFISDERLDVSSTHEITEASVGKLVEMQKAHREESSRKSAFPHLGASLDGEDIEEIGELGSDGTMAWSSPSQGIDEEAPREQSSARSELSSARDARSDDERTPADDLEERSFGTSRERDATGPKAAILRKRTGEHDAIPAENDSHHGEPDTGSFDDDELNTTDNLARRARLDGVRASGLASERRFAVVDWANRIYTAGDDANGGYSRVPHYPAADITAAGLSRSELLLGYADGGVVRVDSESGAEENLFHTDKREAIADLSVSWRGRRAIAGTRNGLLYSSEDIRRDKPWELIQAGRPLDRVMLSADGEHFAVVREGVTTVHSIGKPHLSLLTVDRLRGVCAIALSREGELLGILHGESTCYLYHVPSNRQIASLDNLEVRPSAICFSRNQELLGLYTDQGAFHVTGVHEMVSAR